MGKVVVVYGSTTGTCKGFAKIIASKLGADLLDVTNLSDDTISSYDSLILGSSTWGYGDLQDDWYDGLVVLKSADLSAKTVALFGCGDAESYPDTFCDAVGLIYKDVVAAGAKVVGSVSKDGYSFDASASEVDGSLVGLALDDMNQSDLSDDRIDSWVASIKDLV